VALNNEKQMANSLNFRMGFAGAKCRHFFMMALLNTLTANDVMF
jgi:hypothetical protein